VIFASNVGYFIALLFAVTGFILLRRDQPETTRPLRLGGWAVPVAIVLSVYTVVLLLVGALSPGLAGYGGLKEQLTGLGLLMLGLIGYAVTRTLRSRAAPFAASSAGDVMADSADGPV
jgi:amino acid transporter